MSRYSFFDYSTEYPKEGSAIDTDTKGLGPSSKDKDEALDQAVSDWNRGGMAGVYYVNGKSVADLRGGEKFDKKNLEKFIRTHLTHKVPKDQQDRLTTLAIQHLHQNGLNNAISHNANEVAVKDLGAVLFSSDANRRVDFVATKKGLEVTEEVVYNQIMSSKGNKETTDKGYVMHAKGKTLLTPKYVRVLDVKLDCPHKALSSVLDERNFFEKVHDFVRNIFQSKKVEAKPVPPPQTNVQRMVLT